LLPFGNTRYRDTPAQHPERTIAGYGDEGFRDQCRLSNWVAVQCRSWAKYFRNKLTLSWVSVPRKSSSIASNLFLRIQEHHRKHLVRVGRQVLLSVMFNGMGIVKHGTLGLLQTFNAL
jgi:hypothetical protein